ncbi:unnamed protein product [Diamesa serratosioi]
MDSQAPSEGYLIDIVDNDWRNDKLPDDDISLPLDKLPDPEADTETGISLKEQEDKWLDLAIIARHTADDQLNSSNP